MPMKECFTKICLSCAFLIIFTHSFSQASKELSPGYYIVVAAYAQTREDMASLFAEKLKTQGYNASYGFNSERNLFFVYLNYFGDLKASVRDMLDVRRKGVFTDAWVRVVGVAGDIKPDVAKNEGNETINKSPEVLPSKQVTPPVNKRVEAKQPATDSSIAPPAVGIVETIVPDSAQQKSTNVSADDIAATEREAIKERAPNEPVTLGNTKIFLSLFNGTNNRIVDGVVQVVEPEKGKLITKVKGNEYITLPDPQNSTNRLSLIVDVFGYRKVQYELNYENPLADTVHHYFELVGNTFIAYFDLIRYRRGDILTLYNVYFYNDAAIMLSESKYELNNLVQLMNENPNYRIRFHGHSNANYHGRIISPGPDMNLFSLSGDVKEAMGSSKELSAKRAHTLKQYMIANGIDGSRMEIKAWGGKRPIYDKNGVNAKRNIRVEVEIIED
jgi:outer membrane protein OmpA-like peptidoglycan-associated protein